MDQGSAYFELQSLVKNSNLDVQNPKLIEAMRQTAIQGFGWPIGVVMDVDPYRPRSKDKAVEAIIKTDESFDTWTLTSSGDLYILKTLFEEKRDRTAIFIDVRLARMLEAFARVASLYRSLGVKEHCIIKIQIKFGGILNRILKIANQNRLMSPFQKRVSLIDTFIRVHEARLDNLLQIEHLERVVIKYGCEFAQIFDAFDLNEDIAKEMIKEHALYRGVLFALTAKP